MHGGKTTNGYRNLSWSEITLTYLVKGKWQMVTET